MSCKCAISWLLYSLGLGIPMGLVECNATPCCWHTVHLDPFLLLSEVPGFLGMETSFLCSNCFVLSFATRGLNAIKNLISSASNHSQLHVTSTSCCLQDNGYLRCTWWRLSRSAVYIPFLYVFHMDSQCFLHTKLNNVSVSNTTFS